MLCTWLSRCARKICAFREMTRDRSSEGEVSRSASVEPWLIEKHESRIICVAAATRADARRRGTIAATALGGRGAGRLSCLVKKREHSNIPGVSQVGVLRTLLEGVL
eukprot:scaffold131159_cov28-Tisochrysis_lutea.AAC.1